MSESLFPIVKKQRQKRGSSIEDEAWGSPDTGLKDCNRYTSCLCLPPNVDRSGHRSGHRSGQWQHTRTLSVPTQPAINPHTRCCILHSSRPEGLTPRLPENGSSSNPASAPHTRPSTNTTRSFYCRIQTCLSSSPPISDKGIIFRRPGQQEGG